VKYFPDEESEIWPPIIDEDHDRLVYFYLHTKLTNRLDDIREANECIRTTPLQSTFSLQNNHEILSLKALHSIIPFIFQICNNTLKYLKFYYFVVFFRFRLSQHKSIARLRFQARGEKNILIYVGIISANILYIPHDELR
jgi:hypothetical protein